jgi:hypothetical protein
MVWIRRVFMLGGAIMAALLAAYVEFALVYGAFLAATDGSLWGAVAFVVLALVPPFAGVTMWMRGRTFDLPVRALYASIVAMLVGLLVWFGTIFVLIVIVGPPY